MPISMQNIYLGTIIHRALKTKIWASEEAGGPNYPFHLPPEGDDLLLGDDVLEVGLGPVQRHLLDGLGCLAGVLEVDPEKQSQVKTSLKIDRLVLKLIFPFQKRVKFTRLVNPAIFHELSIRDLKQSFRTLIEKISCM